MSHVNVCISVLLEPAGERDREGKQNQNAGGCCRETNRFLTRHLCSCSSDTNKLHQELSKVSGMGTAPRNLVVANATAGLRTVSSRQSLSPSEQPGRRPASWPLETMRTESVFPFANGHSSRVNIHTRLALQTGFSSTKGSRTSSSHPAPWASLTQGPPRKAGSRPAPHLHSSIKAPNSPTFPPGGSR